MAFIQEFNQSFMAFVLATMEFMLLEPFELKDT
jgi:hypothetical protein